MQIGADPNTNLNLLNLNMGTVGPRCRCVLSECLISFLVVVHLHYGSCRNYTIELSFYSCFLCRLLLLSVICSVKIFSQYFPVQ